MNSKRQILLLFFTSIAFSIWAQKDFNFHRNEDSLTIEENCKYYIVKDIELTLPALLVSEEILKEVEPNEVTLSPSWAIWLKINLSKNIDFSTYQFLSVGNFDEVHLSYQNDSGGWEVMKNGNFIPPSKRVINKYQTTFPINKSGLNSDLWIKVIHYNPLEKEIPLPYILSESLLNKNFIEISNANSENNLLIGLTMGLFFALLVFPISFFIVERKEYYIYYALYIVFNIVLLFYTFEKYSNLNIYFSEKPWTFIHLETSLYVITAVFYFQFLRQFILEFADSKLTDNTLKALIYYEVFILIVDLILKTTTENLNFTYNIVSFLMTPLTFGVLFVLVKVILLRKRVLNYLATGIGFVVLGLLLSAYYLGKNIHFQFYFFANHHSFYHLGILIELLFFTAALSIANQDSRKKMILKESLLKEENERLEKSALQAQMNPHFIFNCLSSIQNFILQNNREKAVEFLSSFAKLVRTNLDSSVNGTISLKEEIILLENYLVLERERFDDKFNYQINVNKNLQEEFIKIPPMLIQPYVENAVIHGIASQHQNGIIQISFEQQGDYLNVEISDNGPGITMPNIENRVNEHNPVGMSITKRRLELLSPELEEAVSTKISDANNIEHSGTTVRILIKLNQKND